METDTTVADQNTERLIQAAYQPEAAAPQFVADMEKLALATAQGLAKRQATPIAPPHSWRQTAFVMGGIAACLLIVYALWHFSRPMPIVRSIPPDLVEPIRRAKSWPMQPMQQVRWTDDVRDGMMPRQRPTGPALKSLKPGETLATKAGERRLVLLGDGTKLYVNEKTEVEAKADRQLTLHKGQIYLEVAPKDDAAKFVVNAGNREVTATGTHFAVQSDPLASGVVVTQGKVAIKGIEQEVTAGQRVAPGESKISTAPRASHALEWTRELMAAAETPMVPACRFAGGALLALDPQGQEIKLALRSYNIDVHIEDGFARTTIDQTYFNTTWDRLEGTFYFPLPADASLSRLAMYVADANNQCKLMEGGMAERKHAADVYETIRYMRRDPALLEWLDGSTFKMRVFPLEAKQEKRIILSYTQKLPSLYGNTRYRFAGGHNMPLVRDWSFTARIKSGAGMSVWSPSHENMHRIPQTGDVLMTQFERNIKPEQDVVIEMQEPAAVADQNMPRFSSFLYENQQYLMLRYRPTLPAMPERKRRDWIVLFEASAGRDPLLAGTQLDIVRQLLKNAEYDDTFTLLTVNTKVNVYESGEPNPVRGRLSPPDVTDPLRGSARPARPKNVDGALAFLQRTHLVGALDLEQGLRAALQFAKDVKNPHILHVGSGIPAIGERDAGKLAQSLPASVTYVGVGVGKRWNRAFMKAAAERTNGVFTQINPDEVISWRAFELLATLNTPRLLDVKVVDAHDKSPTRFLMETTMIAQGEEICAVARIDTNKSAGPGKVIVTGLFSPLPPGEGPGVRGGRAFVKEFPVINVLPGAGYLPRTWAKLQIDRLLAENAAKHKSEIIELSKAMYVMSPFTSLLVLETDADYEKYKVDKGRKDHWAMYQCPPKIPLVYEPDGDKTSRERKRPDAPRKKDAKPTVEEVAGTIVGFSTVGDGSDFVAIPLRNAIAADVARTLDGAFNGGGVLYKTFNTPRVNNVHVISDARTNSILVRAKPVDLLTIRRLVRNSLDEAPAAMSKITVDSKWRQGLTLGLEFEYLRNRDEAGVIPVKGPSGDAPTWLRDVAPIGGGFRNPGRDDKGRQMELERARLLFEKGAIDAATLRELEGRDKNESVSDEWRRAWITDQPGHLTPYKIHGGVGPASESIEPRSRFADPTDPDHPPMPAGDFPASSQYSALQMMSMNIPLSSVQSPPASPPMTKDSRLRFFGGGNRNGDQAPDGGSKPGQGKKVFSFWVGLYRGGESKDEAVSDVSLRYDRPAFAYDRTLFTDLVQYAPGLSASDADILATLEAEADVELPKVGSIDAAAKALIDKARGAGWAGLAVSAQGPLPGYKIAFNGVGQFAYERLLVSGLTEQVICDGKTLTYLYPEIGLVSKRAMSRHHQHLITAINPAFLPGADELARGCDVKAISAATVALCPLTPGPSPPVGRGEKESGPSPPVGRGEKESGPAPPVGRGEKESGPAPPVGRGEKHHRIYLVFAKDGTLSERQIVEMPLGKVVWRQIHHADGSVEWKNGENKSLAKIERSVAPVQAPNLTPNVRELVVVNLPLRSREYHLAKADAASFSDIVGPIAEQMFVTDCLTGQFNMRAKLEHFGRAFHAKGDRRLGFYTLMTAGNFQIPSDDFPAIDGRPWSIDIDKEHPQSALALFLAQCQREMKTGDQSLLKNIPSPKDGFVQRLTQFRNVWLTWQNQRPLLNGGADMPLEKAKVIELLSDTPTPLFAYAILDTMQRRCNTPPSDHMMNLVEKRLGPISDPLGLGYVFKYEQARSIWQTGNGAEAAKLFRELHTTTLKYGVLPPIDPAFREAVQMPLGAGPRFIAFTRKTLDELLAKKRYGLAFQLAKQMEQLGDEALCDEILTTILTRASAEERDGLTLVCVRFFAQRKNYLQADRLLVKVLENGKARGEVLRTPGNRSTSSQGLADYPGLWRWRSALTKEAGQGAVSIACLEKALDLEYADLPEVVNLESIRGDYRALLTQYQKIAEASASLAPLTPGPSPQKGRGENIKAFLAKVIRTADRWRLIDPEHAEPSMMAGKILFTMGERELAWDYWTTPIDLHPAESRPWLELAATMQAEGDLDKADRALAIAFQAEPTNPEILWQRAQNAVRLGQPERARQLYRQIADSDWQERFQGTVEQARGLAGQ